MSTEQLIRDKLPRHVAVIMDGNGRWAEKRSLDRIAGHHEGAESVRNIVRTARQIGIMYLTLFAFSSENWSRPRTEVDALMVLLQDYLKSELRELQDHEIRFRAVGDLLRLPPAVRDVLDETVRQTASASQMTLTLALSYGGRDDILQAVRRIGHQCRTGQMSPAHIDEETFSRFLWTEGLPDPDLLIRTSGELRISNFFLWQLAYTELYVTSTLWPDFREDDFIRALVDYQNRERRFGLTSRQIGAGKDD